MVSETHSEIATTEFETDLNRLHLDKQKRFSMLEWEKLFVTQSEWTDETFKQHQSIMVNYLCDYFATLPKAILQFLYKSFELEKLNAEYIGTYNFPEKLFAFQAIATMPTFSFEQVKQLPIEKQIIFCQQRYTYYLNVIKPYDENAEDVFTPLEKELNQMAPNDLSYLNLQVMSVILSDLNLLLDTSKEKAKKLFSQIKQAGVKPDSMTDWLKIYIETCQTKKLSKEQIHFLTSDYESYFHDDLLIFMTGMLYFNGQVYKSAFLSWQTLPTIYWPKIKKESKVIRKKIADDDKIAVKQWIAAQKDIYYCRVLSEKERKYKKIDLFFIVSIVVVIVYLVFIFEPIIMSFLNQLLLSNNVSDY